MAYNYGGARAAGASCDRQRGTDRRVPPRWAATRRTRRCTTAARARDRASRAAPARGRARPRSQSRRERDAGQRAVGAAEPARALWKRRLPITPRGFERPAWPRATSRTTAKRAGADLGDQARFPLPGQVYHGSANRAAGRPRGIGGNRFRAFPRNHDQIAKPGFGERLVALSDPATLRALTALLLLSRGCRCCSRAGVRATARWQFFVATTRRCARPVRRGRAEFRRSSADGDAGAQAASPTRAPTRTFRACVADRGSGPARCAHGVRCNRDLLHLRRNRSGVHDSAPEGARRRCAVRCHARGCAKTAGRTDARPPVAGQPRADFAARVGPEPLIRAARRGPAGASRVVQ